MRDSRWPRGTWTAPGIWPSSHSSCSRTSTTTGSPDSIRSRALGGVDLRDLGPHLLQELSVVRHRYRKYSFAQLASVACDERARQGLDHRGARCRGRRGDRRRSHARDPKRRPASSRASRRPSLRTRPRRPKWRNRCARHCRPGRRARLGGCGSSPSAIRTAPSSSSSSASRSRCRASRPTRRGRGRRPSVPSRTPRRPSEPRICVIPAPRPVCRRSCPSFTRVTNAVESLLLRGAAYQQALRPVSAEREFAAAAKARSEQPRGADRGGRRPLRQGSARACVLASRARSPAVSRRRRPYGSISGSSDLLRGPASCSSRAGPRPRARPTDTAWKKGRNAS